MTMAKGKATSKSAGKQKVAGGKKPMQKFVAVSTQKPGGSAVTNSGYAKK